jgi:hypothetical protein
MTDKIKYGYHRCQQATLIVQYRCEVQSVDMSTVPVSSEDQYTVRVLPRLVQMF